jgi:alcohol dehydrogenase (cytochrome c)
VSKRILLVTLLAASLVIGIPLLTGSFLPEGLAWRQRVLAHKVRGELPEIPLSNLLRWLAPRSPVYLGGLAERPNVHAEVANPEIRMEDGRPAKSYEEAALRGDTLFARQCAQCHGDRGRGGSAPSLVQSVMARSDWAFLSTVKWGRAGTAMAAQPLNEAEIWDIHAFLRGEARRAAGAQALDASRQRPAVVVSPESIPFMDSPERDWPTYAGNLAGHRHSGLTQINKKNVTSLGLAWVAQLRAPDTPLQTSPITAAGVLYATESREGLVALDAKSGELLWRFGRAVPDNMRLCCGSPNRGAAILGSTVFLTTLDAHLVAVDASTGTQIWQKQVADYRGGYTMTGAPLAFGDRVVVGVAGGEFGIRGFIVAFSAADGRELWRFHTIPAPGEPGADTWSGDAWKNGGGPTWTTGAYDPKTNLVIWGVGNPAPNFNAAVRPGDNLFTNSVIAIDATTGQRKWHYQFTPADEFDWDSVQQPMLADVPIDGSTPRPAVLWANRNGFFYALDRRTGQFLFAKAFAKQTWADGFDNNGRPRKNPGAHPSRDGTLIWPHVGGGTNWWPPSYDPARQAVYVPALDAASLYFSGEPRKDKGEFLGSIARPAGNTPSTAAIRAIDARTGAIRWENVLERGGPEVHQVAPILSTASGLIFSGFRDTFFAMDSDSGQILWSVRLGARISGSPTAYSVDGRQFVAIAAGASLFVFAIDDGVRGPSLFKGR